MNEQPHLVGRVLSGLARTERDKSCHLFALPEDGHIPAMLEAYCGYAVPPAYLEQLDHPRGMPCVSCLLLAQTSD